MLLNLFFFRFFLLDPSSKWLYHTITTQPESKAGILIPLPKSVSFLLRGEERSSEFFFSFCIIQVTILKTFENIQNILATNSRFLLNNLQSKLYISISNPIYGKAELRNYVIIRLYVNVRGHVRVRNLTCTESYKIILQALKFKVFFLIIYGLDETIPFKVRLSSFESVLERFQIVLNRLDRT